MKIIEGRRTFDYNEVLSKPLFAHLATVCDLGPRESPVWFLWEDHLFWILAHKKTDSFPGRISKDPRIALGVIDFDLRTGLQRHVGVRGRGEIANFDLAKIKSIFRKYFGSEEKNWDIRLIGKVIDETTYFLVKITPETMVVRDQSFKV